jgi:pimeloyl-ACP methyl ester carboxylesterase
MEFFPGFRKQTIQTSGTSINVVSGGNGPPLLLLHGYPQTHIEWRKMVPDLSRHYTLVMPDLRGYGDSGKPPEGDKHINDSKRSAFINEKALRFRVPVVSGLSHSGSLIAYAPDTEDLFRRSAAYVDRILRGASPAELPVQLPIKFEMIINLKTATALGLTVPQALLVEADEVIE